MTKVETISFSEEVDTPEVRKNKELMSKFDHGGIIYKKGKENFDVLCQLEEKKRKKGLAPEHSKVYFESGLDSSLQGVPSGEILNKMYDEMTYEKALSLLQSYSALMTNDKNNTNGLNILNAMGRAGSWMVDLALLRIEEWNHAHRAVANMAALALVEEKKETRTTTLAVKEQRNEVKPSTAPSKAPAKLQSLLKKRSEAAMVSTAKKQKGMVMV